MRFSFLYNTPLFLFFVYAACINLIAFLFFGIDKMKAGMRHRRIRERTLLVLALLGGSIGALAAMNFFRHKTKKGSFQAVITLIILIQLLVAFSLIRRI